MIKRAFAVLFILILFLFSSCGFNIQTWQDPDESSSNEGTNGSSNTGGEIGPAIGNIDGIFTEQDSRIIFSLPSNIVLPSGTFLRKTDKNENKLDLRLGISASNATDSYYGIALTDGGSQSDFKAILFSQSGRIRIGKVTDQSWSEKIGIEKSVNLAVGSGSQNSVRILFDEQNGRFSLFINSVHECDFYLDGIRSLDDIQYSFCVCVNNSKPVVEFTIEEEV